MILRSFLMMVCCAAIAPLAAAEPATWRIGARLGMALTTGAAGVEVQRGHYAVAGGAMCFPNVFSTGVTCFPALGMRYYVDESGDTWSFDLFHWSLGRDEGTFTGIAAERHWRWRHGWQVSAGIGVGRLDDEDADDEDTTAFWPSFCVGFSF